MSVIEFNTPPPPRKGDRLFRGDLPDWPNTVRLERDSESAPNAYIRGYLQAAELLVQHVRDEHLDGNVLVYPIVHLYRHHLELALKRLIRRFPRLLNRKLTQNQKNHLGQHRLDLLWRDLKPTLSEIFKAVGWSKPTKEDLEGVDDYVQQLSAVDPDSCAFRYWYTKAGDHSLPEELRHINLPHFAELMSRIVSYIDGIDTAASLVEEWQGEI